MKLPAAIPGVNCAAVVPLTRKGWRGAIRGYAQGPRTGNMNVPMSAIVEAVCEGLRIDIAEFRSNSRFLRVVVARELVAALATDLTRLSYQAIAFAMNRPNHSTVIDAKNRWRDRVERAKLGDQTALIAVYREVLDPQALYDRIREQLERTVAA